MKSSRLSIRVSDEELESIRSSATDAGMSLADFVLNAIRKAQGVKPNSIDLINLHRRIEKIEEVIFSENRVKV